MTKRHAKRRLYALGAALLGLAAPAAARADGGDCRSFRPLKDEPSLTLARVTGGPRTLFLKDSTDIPTCPNASGACRKTSYLVPGNLVIAGERRGPFTCVHYAGARSAETFGWLPSARLAPMAAAPVKPGDWMGTWISPGARIVVRPTRSRSLKLHGTATLGSVEWGGPHIGGFDAVIAPNGAELAFDTSDFETVPVDKGDDVDCKVWMRRLGPFLVVDDNAECGGVNVRFNGVYRRKS